MTQEFEQYQELIEQLKPVVNEPDFNQTLSTIASHVSKPKRFLIKMELKRQAKPCVQIIDLRGLVDGRCSPYEYGELTHFLDQIAIDVFERQVRAFGEYTVGVYEAVNNTENNFRVMHQQELLARSKSPASSDTEPESDSLYPARLINFANYRQRHEERMNFVVNIEIFNQLNEAIPANTIDISINGLKVKLRKDRLFKPHEQLTIQFRGLGTDNTLDKNEGVSYEVINVEQGSEEQRLTLCRTHQRVTPKFDAFLERFIQGNKRRYKVNMDNTIDAIQAKGYEQYYIPQFNSLPMFIEENQGQLQPRYVLTNDFNKDSLHYWTDETGQLRIEHLVTSQRLQQLAEREQKETYLYVFSRLNNQKTFFYSATPEQLESHPQLKPVFLGYGSRKASWRVFKLQLLDMQPEQAHIPLSLPDSLSNNVKKQNNQPSARLMSRLIKLKYIALLTDLTDDWNTIPYQKNKLNKTALPGIKPFAHSRAAVAEPVTLHRFKYQNLRTQERFQLRSKVIINFRDLQLEGLTEDISCNGIKVELNKAFPGRIFDDVTISFPQLQKMSPKFVLKGLLYEVKNISSDGNVLNLNVVDNSLPHNAQLFFDQLIKANKNKLKTYRDDEVIPGIGEALRNIYSANIPNIAFYMRKEGVNYTPDAIAKPPAEHPLLPLLDYQAELGTLNLYPLFATNIPNFIPQTLKKLSNHSKPVMRELFIAFNPLATDHKQAIKVKFVDQFEQDALRREFIAQAIGGGQFFAVKVFIARTGRPDTAMIRTEMNYVGIYAMHKAKQLEEQLWNVTGVGNLIDITEEVLLRYGFVETVMNKYTTTEKQVEEKMVQHSAV